MRINKYVALATGMSRRKADETVGAGRVSINGHTASLGDETGSADVVTLDGKKLHTQAAQTIILNKPVGYVVSRDGQGSRTIYDLLPAELHHLKPVGRLDKDSSGLLVMTNDGNLANELTHPSNQKTKVYQVRLDKPLVPLHRQMISDFGIQLEDGISKFELERLNDANTAWKVTMTEGRNRQIRRTFAALDYTVTALHRTDFGPYAIGSLPTGKYKVI